MVCQISWLIIEINDCKGCFGSFWEYFASLLATHLHHFCISLKMVVSEFWLFFLFVHFSYYISVVSLHLYIQTGFVVTFAYCSDCIICVTILCLFLRSTDSIPVSHLARLFHFVVIRFHFSFRNHWVVVIRPFNRALEAIWMAGWPLLLELQNIFPILPTNKTEKKKRLHIWRHS